MDYLRILYRNLNRLLETELKKLKEFIEEYKNDYQQQDNKLNEILEKTTNTLQEYEFIGFDLDSMKQKVIAIGEKVNSSLLNKIFQIKNPDSQIIFIMKVFYQILKNNIYIIEESPNKISIDNKSNNGNSNTKSKNLNKKNVYIKDSITWENMKKNITYKSILLLIELISEASNLNLSKEIMENTTPLITKYNHYKNCYINTCPEIITIIDFIKILIVYYTEINLVKKLYINNKNNKNKMDSIRSDLNRCEDSIKKVKELQNEILKDYNAFKKSKNIDNKIIYGYNILEKYSLYEKYCVGQESIYNYDEEYYNNYGGNDYNNKISKIKYVIKLNKKFRNKEKFLSQLLSSLMSYSKGIRKINKDKFIQNIKENRNNSLNRNSTTNSINKNNTAINMNNTNNNILLRSIESNNSSLNLYRSFQTNSILNVTINNSTPYRNENSRNNNFVKRSFVDSYPTFDNFFQLSNRNLLRKEGLTASSVDFEQTKNSTKNININKEANSMKNSMNQSNQKINIKNNNNNKNDNSKKKSNIFFRNVKQQQINLKFENEQWTPCTFCCKNIKNKINQMYSK